MIMCKLKTSTGRDTETLGRLWRPTEIHAKLIQSACRDRIGLEETEETVETMETTGDMYMQIQNYMETEGD